MVWVMAVDPAPEVAVIVTVLALAGVPGFETGEELLPLPLPLPHADIARIETVQSTTSIPPKRRFL